MTQKILCFSFLIYVEFVVIELINIFLAHIAISPNIKICIKYPNIYKIKISFFTTLKCLKYFLSSRSGFFLQHEAAEEPGEHGGGKPQR